MGNRLKAKRCLGMVMGLVERHWEMVESGRVKGWGRVGEKLFWFY